MEAETCSIKILTKIFYTFLTIAPATFGGGYAMIPLLEKAVIDKNKWIKKEEMVDLLAVSQTVPGSIAVNVATFVGYRLAGTLGALAATLGVIAPTFGIILILSSLFLGFQHHPIVQAAFLGIRPAIVALILFAAIKTGKTAIHDKTTIFVVMITLACLLFTSIHPIVVILIGGLTGMVLPRKKVQSSTKETDLDYFMGAGI